MKRLEPYSVHEDDRGKFMGITTDHWDEVNLVETRAGVVRGNHYHKVGTEITTQCGPALVVYRDESGTQTLEIKKGEAIRLIIPPGVPHAFKNNGDEPNLLVAFNTEVFDPDNPDVVREVVLEP